MQLLMKKRNLANTRPKRAAYTTLLAEKRDFSAVLKFYSKVLHDGVDKLFAQIGKSSSVASSPQGPSSLKAIKKRRGNN
jgi:hypothetical protein